METGNTLLMKKYQIVYADPPWPHKSGSEQMVVPYPVMSIERIRSLPVQKIIARDAVLFLWTTDKFLPAALKVMQAWGFRYVTLAFIWEKLTKYKKLHLIRGAWTYKSTELCLLGSKGHPHKFLKQKSKALIKAPVTRHSEKPLQARQRIEAMFSESNINKLELFARKKFPGWDAWGNEVKCDIKL